MFVFVCLVCSLFMGSGSSPECQVPCGGEGHGQYHHRPLGAPARHVRRSGERRETRHCRDSGQISISVEDPQLFFRIRSFFFLAGQKAFVKPMYGINVKPLTSAVDVC
jgi:hypothetical protein